MYLAYVLNFGSQLDKSVFVNRNSNRERDVIGGRWAENKSCGIFSLLYEEGERESIVAGGDLERGY